MKRALYILGLFMALGICEANAGTDLLSNALTQSNSFLKEAGLIQKKYSGIARKLVTGKIQIDPDKLKLNKLEKYKEKAESLKEKAEQLQERIANAQERKEELMAKYQELNEKAMEYRDQANSLIAAGSDIKLKYQNLQEDAEELLGASEDNISSPEGLLDNGNLLSSPAETTADVASEDDAVSASSSQAGEPSWQRTSSQPTSANQGDMLPQFADAEFTGGIVSDAVEGVSDDPGQSGVSSRAETIRSAENLATASSVAGNVAIKPTALSTVNTVNVSVSDIMSAAAAKDASSKTSSSVSQSSLNIQEQLQQSSTKFEADAASDSKSPALLTIPQASSAVSRSRFEKDVTETSPNNAVSSPITKEKTNATKL